MAAALIALLLTAGCATSPGAPVSSDAADGQALAAAMPAPPDDEVTGTGTVIEVEGVTQFCLGPVMESFPPQCQGIPVDGWSWDGVEGAEQVDAVIWGTYALTGSYDGARFTVTRPAVPLALHDPLAVPDPTDGVPGDTDADELQRIQDAISTTLDPQLFLGSGVENGYLWLDVVWDDGTIQGAADADHGEGVVIVRPALRPVTE